MDQGVIYKKQSMCSLSPCSWHNSMPKIFGVCVNVHIYQLCEVQRGAERRGVSACMCVVCWTRRHRADQGE